MAVEANQHDAIAAVQTIEYTRKQNWKSTEKVQTGRMKLPADLPREQVILEPAEDTSEFRKIGDAITGVLEHIPRKLFVCQYENGTEWHYLQTFPGHSSPKQLKSILKYRQEI